MFFTKKKVEKKEENGILKKENIKLNCKVASKEEAIKAVGQMLCDSGYVDADYIDGMMEREKTFVTYIGNGIAIPHGTNEVKKAVKKSGIAVMVVPEGVDWGGNEKAKMIIGIAGVGDEHLEILANIAENLSTEEEVEALIAAEDKEKIYNIFVGGDDL